MICPVCRKTKAIYDPYWGFLPCSACQKRQSKLRKPGKTQEMTSDAIKTGRKQFFSDIHPAHHKGVPSREFAERWGEQAMERQGFSKKEIKEAKYVFNDDKPYNEGN